MVVVAFVLFVLGRYRSPQLAGAAVALATFPGLIVSPLAGALLDRWRMSKLVTLDYGVGAATSILVAVLAALNWLPAPLLLAIIGLSSLSAPLSFGGARSLVPVVVPRRLWERANALDSVSYIVATIAGAPLAGLLVGAIGGGWTIGFSGLLTAAAAVLMIGLREPARETPPKAGSVVRHAWEGLLYVLVRNPTLRGLALTLSVTNIGSGIVIIALPVLVLTRLHQGPAVVGLLWGISGAAALVSSLLVGRMRVQGREPRLILAALAINALSYALLPLAAALAVVVASVLLLGIATGPFDIAVFTLRQRRTDPAWFGRVFAVSMSLNSLGAPIGSALAGPLITRSLGAALWVAAAATVAAMLFPLLVIPAED
jgi:predicted MFS family arabinose efflux permease